MPEEPIDILVSLLRKGDRVSLLPPDEWEERDYGNASMENSAEQGEIIFLEEEGYGIFYGHTTVPRVDNWHWKYAWVNAVYRDGNLIWKRGESINRLCLINNLKAAEMRVKGEQHAG